jgi:CRISPR-associated endonuclease/helicase Cas3
MHYAHSLAGRPVSAWHALDVHLASTADLAEGFAASFAPGWGRIAGLWHDAGKYQRAFQLRIGVDPEAHVSNRVDHSTVGALIAKNRGASLLSSVIAGHHGGLPDFEDLRSRLESKRDLLDDARTGGLPDRVEQDPVPAPPSWLAKSSDPQAALSLWTRFLFSALVDADCLDTERFYAEGRPRDPGVRPAIAELRVRLDKHLDELTATAAVTQVNQMRARVLSACREAASQTPGALTLTVPTGGGKTLASLAFALKHAELNNLSRVIVVIPYTSIIEQTARTYRDILGESAIIEHHSSVDPDKETPYNRLVSDNWDAPIIVTTSVQFFESLFANRPSRCRKLHRIARSVVVFDEVQTFPVHLLAPVRHVLRELPISYGATTLFCTATQPALIHAREIVPNPAEEFSVVANRCEILMPLSEDPVTWEALADELREHYAVLAIVHRRDDAQRLAQLVGDDCLHLSARMCASHRSDVLAEVKRRLLNREPCRLVATQLVEAGVDVDFPEVYRAFAGADSLAQAAGRCNREGKGKGRLHVFFAPTNPPSGILRTALRRAIQMWKEGSLNLASPDTFTEYFRRLYELAEQDAKAIMPVERAQNFAQVADLFRMIEENGQPVVAPYLDWERRVADVRDRITRVGMRRLQPFIVNLYTREIDQLRQAGALERVQDSFWAVVPGFKVYDERWGFGWKGHPAMEPESLIA